jgi:hypothetical protein
MENGKSFKKVFSDNQKLLCMKQESVLIYYFNQELNITETPAKTTTGLGVCADDTRKVNRN